MVSSASFNNIWLCKNKPLPSFSIKYDDICNAIPTLNACQLLIVISKTQSKSFIVYIFLHWEFEVVKFVLQCYNLGIAIGIAI